jgi:Na+/H+-dicarboxylate symporter
VVITIDMTIAEIVALSIASGIAMIGMIVGRGMTDGMIVVATMTAAAIGAGIVVGQPTMATGTIREPDLSPKAERPQTITVCGRSVLLRRQWRG